MSDLVERETLVKHLKAIESATTRDRPKFIWDSVYRQIKEEKSYIDDRDCTQCLLSLPQRKWHSMEDIPEIRQRVLVQTIKGDYYISYYASKCWWYEDTNLGDISFFFDENEIIRWKEIE